jgi:ubiquinone/menaquinone biosynthesis C-methylase UbiE
MLEFDEKTALFLEQAYLGADFHRRRQVSFDALAIKPGDTIVDIGCGNGLLTVDLARAVGPVGRVIGVDPSEAMRAPARDRCAEFDRVSIRKGTATDLPIEDNSCDSAVSVQVFEYLEDIPAALSEIRRVLRDGGRLVIGDMHFGTLVWFSDAPERMLRMTQAWDRHLIERALPEHLNGKLVAAGFEVEDVRPLTITDRVLRPDGLAATMLHLLSRYAIQNKLLDAQTVTEWRTEQDALAKAGRFFFSLTHFVTIARKRV